MSPIRGPASGRRPSPAAAAAGFMPGRLHGLHAGAAAADRRLLWLDQTATIEQVSEGWWRLHLVGLRLGVEFALVGREDEIASSVRQQFAVALERSRIAIEILVG